MKLIDPEKHAQMRKALEASAHKFRAYHRIHMEKTPPAEAKAQENLAMAELCEKALEE